MTRFSQSGKKSRRVAEVLNDPGSTLGSVLKRGALLMQLQHLVAGFMDPAVATRFQVADMRRGRLVLVTPTASWATLLRMQAPNLVESLQRAGYTEIRSIEVRVAPLVEPPVQERRKKELSPAARQALDAMARFKADPEA